MRTTHRAIVVSAVIAIACIAVTLSASSTCIAKSATSTSSVKTTQSVAPSTVPTITINAVGDMCFASAPGRLIARKGGKAPFASVSPMLKSADLTLGNLECALSRRGSPVAHKAFTFRGSPKAIQGLNAAGFDVVSLANNHARDYGSAALADTIHNLNTGHIAHAGAGANSASAYAPAILHSHDATIAFLSFCQIGPSNFAAGRKKSGTAYTLDLKKVQAAVKAARRKADYVIVSFHWGIETHSTPTSRQIKFGHESIKAGADLVLSEHPHVIQGVEFYHHKLIAYSLGNFVFSPGSAAGHDSMVLRISIGPHGISQVVARPVYIGSNGAPTLAKGKTAKRILGIIAKTSRGRKTRVSVSPTSATLRP